MRFLGWSLERIKGGSGVDIPPPTAPAVAPQPSAAATFRSLMHPRIRVLPVSGISVMIRPPTTAAMVDAGLTMLALVPADAESMAPAEREILEARVRLQAQRLFCVCVTSPRFRVAPGEDSDACDVLDVPDADLLLIYGELLQWGDSLFYGTHRQFSGMDGEVNYPEGDPRCGWIQQQLQAAALVDAVARRYGCLPHEVEALPTAVFARDCAILMAGRNAEDEVAKEARGKAGR